MSREYFLAVVFIPLPCQCSPSFVTWCSVRVALLLCNVVVVVVGVWGWYMDYWLTVGNASE